MSKAKHIGVPKYLWMLAAFSLPAVGLAQTVTLNPDAPSQYTVQEGDTLWDIASKFLREPWRWEEIWKANPHIKNPDLIFPGDVLTLTGGEGEPAIEVTRAGGRPTVKLSPTVREIPLDALAIPTIPIDAIQQFLKRPRVVGPGELRSAAYVVSLEKEHLVAGAGHKVYVRGLGETGVTRYTVYRAGDPYIDPGSEEVLGYEAIHIADAVLERTGDPATMVISRSNREVLEGDRLLPDLQEALSSAFYPREPEQPVTGKILSVVEGVTQIGQHQIVVLNLGVEDGIEVGHVMAVYQAGELARDEYVLKPKKIRQTYVELDPARQGGIDGFSVAADRVLRDVIELAKEQIDKFVHPTQIDAEQVRLPEERAGLVMVFRRYERVSYALVLDATRPMHIYDTVTNP